METTKHGGKREGEDDRAFFFCWCHGLTAAFNRPMPINDVPGLLMHRRAWSARPATAASTANFRRNFYWDDHRWQVSYWVSRAPVITKNWYSLQNHGTQRVLPCWWTNCCSIFGNWTHWHWQIDLDLSSILWEGHRGPRSGRAALARKAVRPLTASAFSRWTIFRQLGRCTIVLHGYTSFCILSSPSANKHEERKSSSSMEQMSMRREQIHNKRFSEILAAILPLSISNPINFSHWSLMLWQDALFISYPSTQQDYSRVDVAII